MTEKPHRYVVARTKVGRDKLCLYREAKTGKAIFRYTWGGVIECEWNLLSEVSAHFTSAFEHLINQSPFKLELYDGELGFYNTLVLKEGNGNQDEDDRPRIGGELGGV